MLFNSYIFIFVYLPITLLGYYFLTHFAKYRLSKLFLIGMSLWFYGYFNIEYLFIIIFSILLNCSLASFLHTTKHRKLCLWLGIIMNISILFYFKYMDFFIENVNALLSTNMPLLNLLLPLGISFFTFQQLSYIIDSYRNPALHYSMIDYVLFVVFFPQLIAGPIVTHDEMIPQFNDDNKKRWSADDFALGITAFAYGLAKKVLIADTFGNFVNYGFDNISSLGSLNAIFVAVAYTIQIYFDFSGYCDMATGIAKMFRFDLPMNFNSPYKSFSVTEFWKRWHMTLTRFLRNYVYIPLGGNRKGKARTYLNLWLVFLISGIWHGANYTFIVWGILHGSVMVIERMNKERMKGLHPALSWILTFVFINIAWIFFRADSLGDAFAMIKQIAMLQFTPISADMLAAARCVGIEKLISYSSEFYSILQTAYPIIMQLAVLFMVLFCKNTNERINEFKPGFKNAVIVIVLLSYSIMSLSQISTFLYFNF